MLHALAVEKLNFAHSEGSKPFFEEFSFQLGQGKLHLLNGCNGSGKSTLLSILRGEGRGKISGNLRVGKHSFDLSRIDKSEIQMHVALVSQRFDEMIADQFTFEQNLSFASFKRRPSFFSGPSRKGGMPSWMERFGVNPKTLVRNCSGGQRQILSLLMVLAKKPSLLLLDEPTATLDPVNSKSVFEFLKELCEKEGVTILAVCHDHALASQYCSGSSCEIAVDNQGRRTFIHHL